MWSLSIRKVQLTKVLLGVVVVGYGILVLLSFRSRWFNPFHTSGDGLQQLFPLWDAVDPELFKGDLVYQSMKAYLPPGHYWLSWLITKFTYNPVMTGHWVMLIQLLIVVGALSITVWRLAGTVPALFSLLWFFHTKSLIYNLGSGLPRGWWGPVLLCYLAALVCRRQRVVIGVLFLSVLFNPPAAFLANASYGSFLVWQRFISKQDKGKGQSRELKLFLLCCPLIFLCAIVTLHRPAELGNMVTFSQASLMPEFGRPAGRFPFLPFAPAVDEVTNKAFKIFGTAYSAGDDLLFALLILSILMLMVAVGGIKKQKILPTELVALLLATLIIYLAARVLAFNLYVPSRYLGWPPAIFFLIAVPVGISRLSRLFVSESSASSVEFTMLTMGALIVGGLSGVAIDTTQRPRLHVARTQGLFNWARNQTAPGSVFAGHPRSLDMLPLFAARRAYITEETAHPFYDAYYAVAAERIRRSLRALYARDTAEFVSAVTGEQINYFVFSRKLFDSKRTGEGLSERYALLFAPFDGVVRGLTKSPRERYWYSALENSNPKPSYVVYQDKYYLVLDVNSLSNLK